MAIIQSASILFFDLPQCRKLGYAPANYNTGSNPIYQGSSITSVLNNFAAGYGYNDGKYLFDASNSYINYGRRLDSATEFTFVIWATQNAIDVFEQMVYRRASDIQRINMFTYTDGKLYYCIGNTVNAWIAVDYSKYVTAGQRHMYAFTFNGGSAAADRAKMYIDGVAPAAGDMSRSADDIPTGTASFVNSLLIGASADAWSGSMDAIMVWTKELTASEISTLYAMGPTLYSSELESDGDLNVKPYISGASVSGHTVTINGSNFKPWTGSEAVTVSDGTNNRIIRSATDSQIVITGDTGTINYTVTNVDGLTDSESVTVAASTRQLTIAHNGDSISKLGVYENIGTWLELNFPNCTYIVDNVNNGGVIANWLGNHYKWFRQPVEYDNPDIALLNSGVHDRTYSGTEYADRILAFFKDYKARYPKTWIVWANSTHVNTSDTDYETRNTNIDNHNTDAVTALNTVYGEGNWTLIDQRALQVAESIAFSDAVHPTTAGYVRYAMNWESGLAPVLESYSEPEVATVKQVAFGICPNCPADFKTGTPTVSIASGVATFSAAQTHDLMGVGAEISYNDGEAKKCYVKPSGKISTTQWRVTTATGTTPANCTDATVSAITHPFASQDAASTGFVGANYINNTDRTAAGADVEVHICGYYHDTQDTSTVNWGTSNGDAAHKLYFYAPVNVLTECNKAHGVTESKYDATKYTLYKAFNTFYKTGAYKVFMEVRNLQIYQHQSGTSGTAQGVGIDPGTFLDEINFNGCIIIMQTPSSGTATFRGVFIGTSGSGTYQFTSNIIIGIPNGGTNSGSAFALNSGATAVLYNNTIHGDFLSPFVRSAGTIISKNNSFTGMTEAGTEAGDNVEKDYDCYDVDEGETHGKLTTQTDAQLFFDVSDASPLNWNYKPRNSSDLKNNGIDLGILYNGDLTHANGTGWRPKAGRFDCGAIEIVPSAGGGGDLSGSYRNGRGAYRGGRGAYR